MQILKYLILLIFLASCAFTPTLTSYSYSELNSLGTNINASLDVNIEEFDPGLDGDSDTWKKKGIWPELRRTESRRFAYKLKEAFEKTNLFGSAYVTPKGDYLADIVIEGSIIISNGEDLHLKISAKDSSNRSFINKTYKHRVKEEFFSNQRNKDKDAYNPLMRAIVGDVVKYLSRNDVQSISKITELRYATQLNEENFSDSLSLSSRGTYSLNFIPAANDPNFINAQNIRSKDLNFRDQIQSQYVGFLSQVDSDYKIWQKEAFKISKRKREAEAAATGAAIAGAFLAIASAYSASESYSSGNYYNTAPVWGTLGAAALISQSMASKEEAKRLTANINQISASLDSQVAPTVIEFEGKTLKFEGTIESQFKNWKAYLNDYFEEQNKINKEIEVL